MSKSPMPDGEGMQVQLSKDGECSSLSVARLLLLAHGTEPDTPTRVARKIDPDGEMCLSNLEWRRPITKSKLTEDQAAKIYKWAWETSMTHSEIAQHFGVSSQTISHIKNGYNWAHVTEQIDVTDY